MEKRKDGILVTKLEKHENTGSYYVLREVKQFDASKENEYLELFNKFCIQGKIKNQNFKDNLWILYEKDEGYSVNRILKFNFEIKPYINKSLKYLCIDLLTNSIGIPTVVQYIQEISKVLYKSNFFDENYYEKFEDYIFKKSSYAQGLLKECILRYLRYMDYKIDEVIINEEYTNLFLSLENSPKNRRLLPDYKSILYFDYFINKFLQECDYNLRMKYMPVVIWWLITSIIPMRPKELTKIKKHEVYEENGLYYIEVTRSKPHSFVQKALEQYKKQKFQISEIVYKIIKEYLEDNRHVGEYILSYHMLKSFFKGYPVIDRFPMINTAILRNLLDKFYKEIISEVYHTSSISKMEMIDFERNTIKEVEGNTIKEVEGNKIVQLHLGDTRHLAIINMVMQGVNPLTIKEMAGHRDINSHSHYSNHIEHFVQSKTLVLTNTIISEVRKLSRGYFPQYELKNRRLETVKKHSYRNQDLLVIGNHICTYYTEKTFNMFPKLCTTICRECKFSIKAITEISEEELALKAKDLEVKINNQINIIKLYMNNSKKHRLIDEKNNIFNFESKKALDVAAKRMNNLIEEKSKYNAYKLVLKECQDEKQRE